MTTLSLSQRLKAVRSERKMYSAMGAAFQEEALGALDYRGSVAHSLIGKLVDQINNDEITLHDARATFRAALRK